jgi:LPS O-antigen subunit length determinant protein (WzzB/FepE family)
MDENLIGIIRALYQKRKAIIGISIFTTLLVAGLSLLLPDYFRANTIFYAASPDLAKPALVGVGSQKRDYYGESEDVDRLLSLAESSELRGKIISHFSLYDHYKIDPDSKLADFKVNKKLIKAFSIQKNKFDAIQLSIEDLNPILSRDMTNYARDNISLMAQKLIKDSQKKLLVNFENNLRNKGVQITKLNNIVDSLRAKFEIFDTKTQGQVIAELLTKTRSKFENVHSRIVYYKNNNLHMDSISVLGIQESSLKKSLASIERSAKNFNAGFAQLKSIENEQSEASDQFALDKERYKSLKSTFESDFSALHVVEYASKPKRKFRPKRSILVITAGFSAFIFSCLAAIIFSFYKKVNWKDVLKDE